MKKRTTYTHEALGTLKLVRDTLPAPDQLVLREEKVKVTISLSKASVDFFRTKARENRTQYQKLIRNLLDFYAAQHRTPKNRTPRSREQGVAH